MISFEPATLVDYQHSQAHPPLLAAYNAGGKGLGLCPVAALAVWSMYSSLA